ncbi:unnamed protein product [Danaus chrysippus]|uniref:(African queen) hypothetical protein n=1 Tax=Danaus chrysippus TaxID=151541 RepID=A0A8J2MF35_9NEOP|nr:unnamed protein product [Danaus chrysippus]
MSLRNVRKLYGATALPPPNESSDEEYEPLYAKNSARSAYAGLLLSSSSEDHESPLVSGNNSGTEDIKKKKKKKKKKQDKIKRSPQNSFNGGKLDEIDKSLMEVNALLGEPELEASSEPKFKPDLLHTLFSVKYKHLNVSNELLKMFGPETPEETPRRVVHGRQPNLKRIQKYSIIPQEFNFKKLGLSMSVDRRDHGISYFVYDHSREYQRVHKEFMVMLTQRATHLMTPFETSLKNMHVEGLLEASDVMFRLEDYSAGNKIVEQVIAYMQFVAHPSFNVTDMRVRLEYKYLENRPFHIALLKYLHLLTNKACHRTALEIAKLMLNLDPSDPLAVIFIIDTVALRAREHQWLIDAIDYLNKEREAGFMFNIQFSYALAYFHILTKNKQSIKKADELLQKAMAGFPWALMQILHSANYTPDERLRAHPLFNSYAFSTTCKNLKDLILLYATFTGARWREPPVMEWLIRNANELADRYDVDPSIKEQTQGLQQVRQVLFRGWPEQVYRHLSVIKTLSNLLVDGAVPRVAATRCYDPVPPRDGVNRYGYTLIPHTHINLGNAILTDFFTSLLPNYDIPPEDEF